MGPAAGRWVGGLGFPQYRRFPSVPPLVVLWPTTQPPARTGVAIPWYPRRPTDQDRPAVFSREILPPVSAVVPFGRGRPHYFYRPENGSDLTKDPEIGAGSRAPQRRTLPPCAGRFSASARSCDVWPSRSDGPRR